MLPGAGGPSVRGLDLNVAGGWAAGWAQPQARGAQGRCPVGVGSGLGDRINWVGILTLTQPLTSYATLGRSLNSGSSTESGDRVNARPTGLLGRLQQSSSASTRHTH